MPRRSFLAALGAGAVGSGALLASRAAWAGPGGTRAGGLDRIGLALNAVRAAMKENPEKTLAAIRAIGYTDVELLWNVMNFDRSPQQVKATLKAEGLTATSAHIAPAFGWRSTTSPITCERSRGRSRSTYSWRARSPSSCASSSTWGTC